MCYSLIKVWQCFCNSSCYSNWTFCLTSTWKTSKLTAHYLSQLGLFFNLKAHLIQRVSYQPSEANVWFLIHNTSVIIQPICMFHFTIIFLVYMHFVCSRRVLQPCITLNYRFQLTCCDPTWVLRSAAALLHCRWIVQQCQGLSSSSQLNHRHFYSIR